MEEMEVFSVRVNPSMGDPNFFPKFFMFNRKAMGPWANGTPKMVIGKFVKIMSGCQWIYWRPFLQTNPYNLDHIYIFLYNIYISYIYISILYIYTYVRNRGLREVSL